MPDLNDPSMVLKGAGQYVHRLSFLYKEPLLLTTVEGLSQEATAAVLRTTTKAIEMRLRRARQKLTEALNQPVEG